MDIQLVEMEVNYIQIFYLLLILAELLHLYNMVMVEMVDRLFRAIHKIIPQMVHQE